MRVGLQRESSLRLLGRCALCGFWLIVALPLTILPLIGLVEGLGLESILTETALTLLGLVVLIVVHVAAGGAWGRALAGIAGYENRRRIGSFAALGFALATALAFFVLTEIEQNLSGIRFNLGLRTHHIFLIAFTLAMFWVAGASWLALGAGTRDRRLAVRLALAGGLTGALTFAAVTLIYDALGFRVGALGAEERATMIVVSLSGLWLSALTGSAIGGILLAGSTRRMESVAIPSLSG